MKTVFDVVSLVMFAGLAILFLQRSASQEPDKIALWKYAVAAIGCAVGDYLGDHDQAIASILILTAVAVFSVVMLRPFHRGPPA